MTREAVEDTGSTRAAAGVTGAVVVAHGGTSISTEPVSQLDLAVLRMGPLAHAIRHALRGRGVVVSQPRYQVRGWNGELASPVPDLRRAVDEIGARYGDIPVVLIGHSMGARAAFRLAGHPAVSAVAGLAPWLPPEEPVNQLADRRGLPPHRAGPPVAQPPQTPAYAKPAPFRTPGGADGLRHRLARYAPLFRLDLSDENADAGVRRSHPDRPKEHADGD